MTFKETTDQQPPRETSRQAQDRLLLVWQWIFGCAAAAALVAAAIVSTTDPTLTYEDLEPTGETVKIECRSAGMGFAGQRMASPSSSAFGYQVTSGDTAYEAWEEQEAERFNGVSQTISPSDYIEAACASADTRRLRIAVWVLVLAFALAGGFSWVALTRLRDRSTLATPASETGADADPDATERQSEDGDTPKN